MYRAESKPRGRITSYAFFVKTCKEEHERQHPGVKLDFKEFSKTCAAKWNSMVPNEKRPFERMSEQDKIRYENEMASYIPPPGEKKRKLKRARDPNAPKRALSAFFFFCKSERPKILEITPNLKVSEVATELGRRWRNATTADKAMYEANAMQDKVRYEQEMAVFRGQKPLPTVSDEEEDPEVPPAKQIALNVNEGDDNDGPTEGEEEEEEEEEEAVNNNEEEEEDFEEDEKDEEFE